MDTDRKLNLILHCGAERVSREELAAVNTPQPSGRHYPVPHDLLVNHIQESMTAGGCRVVQEAHGLTKDGARYFGLFELAGGEDRGYRTVVGLRNSHDKTFAAQLALGSGVFVCDNLSFSGQIVLARKHTRMIRNDLAHLSVRAIAQMGEWRIDQDRRVEAYQERDMDTVDCHDFVVRSVDAKVIPASKFPRVLHEFRNPQHDEFADDNLWSLVNAYTEVLKGDSQLVERTRLLHAMADAQCEFAAAV